MGLDSQVLRWGLRLMALAVVLDSVIASADGDAAPGDPSLHCPTPPTPSLHSSVQLLSTNSTSLDSPREPLSLSVLPPLAINHRLLDMDLSHSVHFSMTRGSSLSLLAP